MGEEDKADHLDVHRYLGLLLPRREPVKEDKLMGWPLILTWAAAIVLSWALVIVPLFWMFWE